MCCWCWVAAKIKENLSICSLTVNQPYIKTSNILLSRNMRETKTTGLSRFDRYYSGGKENCPQPWMGDCQPECSPGTVMTAAGLVNSAVKVWFLDPLDILLPLIPVFKSLKFIDKRGSMESPSCQLRLTCENSIVNSCWKSAKATRTTNSHSKKHLPLKIFVNPC